MSDETITINKVEMKSILPQLRKWWNEYQSGKLNLDGKINIACVIGERGGRIIMEFEALHTQVEQAEEREKVVTATYQAQQHSYRELEAVYSACVEDKQQAEAENARLRAACEVSEQCINDFIEVYKRDCSLLVFDEAVKSLRDDALRLVRIALAAQ